MNFTLRWKKNTNCLNCINYHQVFMVNARLQSTNFQQRESRLIAGKSLQNQTVCVYVTWYKLLFAAHCWLQIPFSYHVCLENVLEISKASSIFLSLYYVVVLQVYNVLLLLRQQARAAREAMAAASVSCLLKIASLNKFELCWCCHKTSWQPLLFDGYLLTLQEHFLTTTISFPNENRIHSYQLYSPRVCLPLTMFMPNRPYIIIIGNHYSDYFGH